jgi:hypothetical protein
VVEQSQHPGDRVEQLGARLAGRDGGCGARGAMAAGRNKVRYLGFSNTPAWLTADVRY